MICCLGRRSEVVAAWRLKRRWPKETVVLEEGSGRPREGLRRLCKGKPLQGGEPGAERRRVQSHGEEWRGSGR